LNWPSRFFGVAPCMTVSTSRDSYGFIQRHLAIRVVDLNQLSYFFQASSAILIFELWILIPQIIPFRLAAPSCYSSCGS
jgi:hypothetical protein